MKNCDTPKRSDLPLPMAKIFEHWAWCRKHQKVCPLGPSLVKSPDDRYHLCKPKHLCFTAWMLTEKEGKNNGK